MSCRGISIEEFDKIMPVIPPRVNKKINPRDHSIEISLIILPPFIVAIQLNTLIPVGIAITMVAAVK